jgi:trans-aconitate methyltransferase
MTHNQRETHEGRLKAVDGAMSEYSATSGPKASTTHHEYDDLRRREESTRFYEDRFAKGYVEEWPHEKKQRVAEIVRGLGLPVSGIALEYGCGNGVFTAVLQEALPNWTVEGGDLSETAVANSSARYPHLRFYVLKEEHTGHKTYDFVFTHHVLEHVYDLDRAWEDLIGLLKPTGSMLHILPCGNRGSLEHRLCVLRIDGISSQRGNRFFFEDEGHLRRLSTNDLTRRAVTHGFDLVREYYANQFYGTIDWVTASSHEFVQRLTERTNATGSWARTKLWGGRHSLAIITWLRQFSMEYERIRRKSPQALKHVVFLVGTWGLYVTSKRVDRLLKSMTAWEWETKKEQRNGSEMYLYFAKRR